MLAVLLCANCGGHGLFDTASFMPHGHCYFWQPEIVWSHAISDAIIAISYFMIPYALVKLIRKRPDMKYKNMFLLFGIFIVACGTTHILSIINIWTPLYRLDALVKIITALASLPTAIILIRIIPEAIKIPSLAVWEQMNQSLKEQIASLKEKDKTIEKVKEFEFLSNSIPQIVWTAQPNGFVDYFNQYWYDYTGRTSDTADALDWPPVIHPEDLMRCIDRWALSYNTGVPYEMEYRFLRGGDGQYRWHLGRALPMKDEKGNITKWFGTSTDIHDVKTAQQLIVEVSTKFQTVLNNVPIIVWSVDQDKVYTMSEGKGLENLGLKPRQMVGLPSDTPFQNMSLKWIENIESALSGKEFRDVEIFGHVFLETSFAPIKDAHDVVTGMVAISLDITKSKQAEIENQFKSRFLSNMSHEIRTPLNTVIGFANILKKTTLNNEQKQYVQLINQSGEMLLNLIGDVLDISKIEEGKLTIDKAGFNIRQSIEFSLQPYIFSAQERGLEFSIEFDDAIPEYVIGDRNRINQVLVNLTGNALKFTSKGKILVKVEQVVANEKQVRLMFSIADTGIGIPSSNQQHIFESFTQADLDVTRQFGGSGLGLSIVKQLVTLMDGTIHVSSPHSLFGKPQGTCFWFALAFDIDKETSHPAKEEEVLDYFDGKVKILMAEDNEVNRIFAKVILRNLGCEFVFAHNGKECVTMLQEDHYDMVLMDVQMPIMDGIAATIAIRKELNSNIPIIGLSANVAKHDIELSLEAGMNDHIGKPYTEYQICQAINKWVITPRQAQVFNLQMIHEVTDDPAEIRSLLEAVLEQALAFGSKITRAIETKDWTALSFIVHGYKSPVRMIGAEQLLLLVQELEQAAKSGNEGLIEELMPRVIERNEVVVEELKKEISKHD
ncbi:MAG: evgS [Chitinophagaceae bacterium]|nr:evgS [Chitinophagaceae bacterium]